MSWAPKRAVDVHDETAGYFSAEYSSDNVYNSPFRYGRSLIDKQWRKVVDGLPAGATSLDIGSGIGAYMARLIDKGFEVHGIEPSAEMRKLARERVPPARSCPMARSQIYRSPIRARTSSTPSKCFAISMRPTMRAGIARSSEP